MSVASIADIGPEIASTKSWPREHNDMNLDVRTCPACGGGNASDAVFCSNRQCGKALGEFRYVLEEVTASTSVIQRLADRVNELAGKPHFVTVHILWFSVWIGINSGFILGLASFDDYPYDLLGFLLSVEAILLTGFLLISNSRQNAYANKRAELDYEVNVRAYRMLQKMSQEISELRSLAARPDTRL